MADTTTRGAYGSRIVYTLSMTVEVDGPHALADLSTLASAAIAQWDDPRDEEGDRVGFEVAVLATTLTESVL